MRSFASVAIAWALLELALVAANPEEGVAPQASLTPLDRQRGQRMQGKGEVGCRSGLTKRGSVVGSRGK